MLLTRLNLADEAWMTLEGRYLARCADGTEALLPAGANVTVLLRRGQLVLFHDGLSLNAGKELKFLPPPGRGRGSRHPVSTSWPASIRET